VLDYIPGRFEIVRHIRPALSCRTCERMTQMPMPSLPIERGRPGAGLLAHILVSKYCDHTPLYRQAGIYAREGVDLDRAVMANWVGKSVWITAPVVEAIGDHVMASAALHADDTPVPVLAPGLGKTKTGRLWVYLRDERPHAGPAPPAVIYCYSPDRSGEHPRKHMTGFGGFLHADGYAGFGPLYQAATGWSPVSPRLLAGRMCGANSMTCTLPLERRSPKRCSTASEGCSISSARPWDYRRTRDGAFARLVPCR
jgi:transposase